MHRVAASLLAFSLSVASAAQQPAAPPAKPAAPAPGSPTPAPAAQSRPAASRPVARLSWTQLSLGTCGVDSFLAAHPQSNGRGVVVAVLDTGVDMSIPGLTQLPEGGIKVIDVQDFTGDGDVDVRRIRLDPGTGKLVHKDADGTPIEYEPPQLPSGADKRLWWLGTLDEHKFVNSDVPDINGNGTTDDKFPVLVTALDGAGDDEAAAYVDANLDRSFADEKPLRNYKLKFDTFTFKPQKPESELPPLTFAVNILLRPEKISFFFDNNGHGTHVAGIAAGWKINNQEGFNGVAPGARVIGLKIGNGSLGGTSTTGSIANALRYAAKFADEHSLPVVCNLSFGVESEVEGESAIDQEVDQILNANPALVFCTSAGNSGPGLSSVGTPGAAGQAITVAALLAADTARDQAGYTLPGPIITTFSSRGGELPKPDFATPGWSTSTVPRFVRGGDFWSGTSMASPYAAGLCALLVSDALQCQPGARVRAFDVRRALAASGQPVAGLTQLDYGAGVPEMAVAAEALAKSLPTAANDPVIGYELSTLDPYGARGKAPAAYWRATWFPAEERQTFTIRPVFSPTADAATRSAFTRQYELRSLASWCRVPQSTVYLHSAQDMRVFVEYDAKQLTEPGLHVGVVEGLADGALAFRLLNTIVIPLEFNIGNNFTQALNNRTASWVPDRHFIAVPPGASGVRVRIAAPEGKTSKAGLPKVYDPQGHELYVGKRLDTENGVREAEWTATDDLVPGIWELPVTADRPDRQWPYDLTVQFYGLHAEPAEITSGSPAKPSGEVSITNLFEKPLGASGDGQIEGFRFEKSDKFKGLADELSYPIGVQERCNRVRLWLEMTPEAYATTTDIAVLVKDGEGEAVYKGAFETRTLEATFDVGGKRSLTLVIHPGFATEDDEREVPIDVKIDQLLAAPININVSQGGESSVQFIPSLPVKLNYDTAERIKDIPGGQRPVGYLRFRARGSNEVVLRIPLDIGG